MPEHVCKVKLNESDGIAWQMKLMEEQCFVLKSTSGRLLFNPGALNIDEWLSRQIFHLHIRSGRHLAYSSCIQLHEFSWSYEGRPCSLAHSFYESFFLLFHLQFIEIICSSEFSFERVNGRDDPHVQLKQRSDRIRIEIGYSPNSCFHHGRMFIS